MVDKIFAGWLKGGTKKYGGLDWGLMSRQLKMKKKGIRILRFWEGEYTKKCRVEWVLVIIGMSLIFSIIKNSLIINYITLINSSSSILYGNQQYTFITSTPSTHNFKLTSTPIPSKFSSIHHNSTLLIHLSPLKFHTSFPPIQSLTNHTI